jgi:hypothetical protein
MPRLLCDLPHLDSPKTANEARPANISCLAAKMQPPITGSPIAIFAEVLMFGHQMALQNFGAPIRCGRHIAEGRLVVRKKEGGRGTASVFTGG